MLQPEFLPGFSFSADYFDIDIDDVITAPDAQQIMDACYDAADLNNQFCGLFQRSGRWRARPNEPAPTDAVRAQNGTLQQTLLNYASSQRARHRLRSRATPRHRRSASSVRAWCTRACCSGTTSSIRRIPNDPDQVLYELGDPKNAFNLNTDFAVRNFKFGYQLRYIGHMVINLAEDVFSVGAIRRRTPTMRTAEVLPGGLLSRRARRL